MIQIYTGLPGAGKSTYMAYIVTELAHRNAKYFKKTGKLRRIYSNIYISDWFSKEYPDMIKTWADPRELVDLRDVDIVWDEIATHLDSTQWANMSLSLKRWLQQHRKYGIEIYGTTQDFNMVDISMRRLCSDLFWVSKPVGTPDPTPTRPPINRPWGLIIRRRLDPQTYSEDRKEVSSIFSLSWLIFTKKLISIFDTRQEIKEGEYPPLNHVERRCLYPGCNKLHVVHR